MNPIAEKRGFNGTIRVYEDYIEIDRAGHFSAWTAALVGKHSIHFSDVFSLGFKKRGILVGWIRIDPKETKADFKNQNYSSIGSDYCITFQWDNKDWEQFYEYLKETIFNYKREHIEENQ